MTSVQPPDGFDLAVDVREGTQYATTAFGSLWIVQPDLGTVTRLDPDTGEAQAVVDLSGLARGQRPGPHLQGVTANDDGVWVTASRSHSLVCIDPKSNAIGAQIAVDGEPYAAAAQGRTLWVTDFQRNQLLKVDTEAGSATRVGEVIKPTGVAVGADSVWVVEHRAGTVVRFDAKTGQRQDVVTLGGTLEQPAFGHGALWVAGSSAAALYRVEPEGQAVEQIPVGGNVYAVAIGTEAVWIADGPVEGCDMTNSHLSRVDPVTFEIARTPLACAAGTLVAGDRVWALTDTAPTLLARLATS